MSKVFNMVGGGGGPYASIFVTGLSETDSVTATHKMKVQVPNPVAHGLPDGYTELEYIQSSGTQYIDTGISENSTNLTVECDGTSLGTGFTLFGSGGGTNGWFEVLPAPDKSFTRFNYGASQIDISGGPYDGVFKMDRNMCYINGSLVHTFSSTSWSVNNIWLFGRNYGGNLDNSGVSTIRYCKIWVADVLVRHFIPCKNREGTLGLYDLVNDIFYTNSGTGTFTAGAEIPTYIETIVEDKTLTGKWTQKTTTVTNSPLIPTMTSNTEPSGVVSASAEFEDKLAYKAFDGDSRTWAYGNTDAIPWTVQYDFERIVSIESFSYAVSQPSGAGYRTGTHKVEISMDRSSWETIFTGTTTEHTSNPKSDTVYLDTKKSARYIRWVTTSMTGGSNPSENLHSLQVYGDAEVPVSGFEISPIRDFGTWTVTATDGTNTTTQDVLVDVITEYEIEITKKLYLYRDGDECEDVTGGWTASGYSFANSTGVSRTVVPATKNNDNMFVNGTGAGKAGIAGTARPIDFSKYNTLYIDALSHGESSTDQCMQCMINDSKNIQSASVTLNKSLNSNLGAYNTKYVYSIDVSSIDKTAYLAFVAENSSTRYGYVYKVWLEK